MKYKQKNKQTEITLIITFRSKRSVQHDPNLLVLADVNVGE